MQSERDVPCKPFKNHHAEQLKLVSSFDWIDFERLADAKDWVTAVLSDPQAHGFLDEPRIRAVAAGVERRINDLKRLAASQTAAKQDSTEDDVRENVAERYD